jgi:hypothetical protein
MAWHDGITLQDAQAALLATINAMYVIPSGERSLPPQEHLATLERLCDGGSGAWGGADRWREVLGGQGGRSWG